MMNINFMDFDIQKENGDGLKEIFLVIREEMEWHNLFYKTYPKKVYVYKHYINFMADDKKVNKNNMIIAI